MVMGPADHLGFKVKFSHVRNGVFIPKYYNPEIRQRLEQLSSTHELVVLGDLVRDGHVSISTGHEIGKMAYGTGSIPFVRTSDISNWEIKTDPKQGVSEHIYAGYSVRQDVRAGDIFLVRDGTYLIGQSCMVTELDLPCLYQSHVLKIRVNPGSPLDRYLLFAALNAPVVKRQIRARQFTADIIDTIGNRYLEVTLPIPKDRATVEGIVSKTKLIIEERAAMREKIKEIPLLAQGVQNESDAAPSSGTAISDKPADNLGFKISVSGIRNGIFIPKYYNPQLDAELSALSRTHQLVSLGDLFGRGVVTWDTGIEVGKMAYGTGPIPFVRTSDLSNWELKIDPKQNVSEKIYKTNKQDILSEDIFLVRDGTYLVGSSCMVTEGNTKILYAGGLYKLRVLKKNELDPYLLLALLNTPVVKRQMRSKQFTRDIIDTLGKRLFEVLIPISKDISLRERVSKDTRKVMETRMRLLASAKEVVLAVEDIAEPRHEKALQESL